MTYQFYPQIQIFNLKKREKGKNNILCFFSVGMSMRKKFNLKVH